MYLSIYLQIDLAIYVPTYAIPAPSISSISARLLPSLLTYGKGISLDYRVGRRGTPPFILISVQVSICLFIYQTNAMQFDRRTPSQQLG